MTDAELCTERNSLVQGSAWLVWAIAGDSNRWDRVIGAGPSMYTRELAPDGSSIHVGHGTIAGIAVSWLERGEWSEGEFVVGERRYLSGPLSVAGFRVDVAKTDAGTSLRLRAYLTPAQPIPSGLHRSMQENLERAADRYVAALSDMFNSAQFPTRREGEAAASYGRRALLSIEPDEIIAGHQGAAHDEHLTYALSTRAGMSIDPAHRDKVVHFLRTRPDFELEQVRPFELASAWGVGRRELLRSFLFAATAGLFDLRWQLNCPRCRVGAQDAARMSDIDNRAHCDVCDIDFDVDFASNVEAVFRANPAIRELQSRVYCSSSPWFRPHVFAVVELAPGQTSSVPVPYAEHGFIARSLRGKAYLHVPAATDKLRLDGSGLAVVADGLQQGGTTVAVTNETDTARTVLLERRLADSDATRGTDILAMPEFLDLYGTEAPASGADLSISSVTVLFSDLTNTTQLYRRVGDSRAFAFVHEHFRHMRAIIARHGGAMIKTMGDAIMASFVSPGSAVKAGLEMAQSTRASHGEEAFLLKVGIHHGPCVMVRANDKIDLFGTTVNMAWRLQEQAAANEVVVLSSLVEHADVARAIEERGVTTTTVDAHLRGIGPGYQLAIIQSAE